MQYKAVVKQSEGWWIGWLIDLPSANAQEKTKAELIESLKAAAEDILSIQYETAEEEELISIEV